MNALLTLSFFLSAMQPQQQPENCRFLGECVDMPIAIVIPGVGSSMIVQQAGDRMYVPVSAGLVSQFEDAGWYGTIGLLGHDYLDGQNFYRLDEGDRIILVYENYMTLYQVTDVYQMTPSHGLTEYDIFKQVYRNGGLVLQTCRGDGFWFVKAEIISTHTRSQ